MKNYLFWLQYLKGKRKSLLLEPDPGRANGQAIVLAHGLLYRAEVMRFMLGDYLCELGFRVYIYDYDSTRPSVRELGRRFREYLETIPEPFQLITHSMGGLLARVALETPLRNAQSVLMIAPPNRGSRYASNLCRRFPPIRYWLRTLPELRCETEGVTLTLPETLSVPVGVLAAQYDNKVDMRLTRFPGATEYVIVPAGHCGVMMNPEARRLMLCYLNTGKFV